jgi:hypothetical protein
MAKKKKTKVSKESDQAYVLKLVLYLLIGTQWIRFVDPELTRQIPIPIGFIVGVIFASHEHFQIDRKIEYAVLSIAMVIGFWLQSGIYVTLLK